VALRIGIQAAVLALLLSGADTAIAQLVHGVVSDNATGEPVAAAVVILLDAEGAVAALAATGSGGRYEILASAPGEYAVQAQQMGYGTRTSPRFSLAAGRRVRIDLELTVEPVTLDPIRVQTGMRERRDRTLGVGATVLQRTELRRMADRGARVGDVANRIPGLNITYGRFYGPGHESVRTYIACIQSSRPFPTWNRGGPQPWCDMVEVYIDDVPVMAAGMVLAHSNLSEFERIEYVPSLGAHRWGLRATETGVLLLWHRRP
jgi:hypothetical protein